MQVTEIWSWIEMGERKKEEKEEKNCSFVDISYVSGTAWHGTAGQQKNVIFFLFLQESNRQQKLSMRWCNHNSAFFPLPRRIRIENIECALHKLHSLQTTPEYYSNLNMPGKEWAREKSASDEKCIQFSIAFALLLLSTNINLRMRNEVKPYCREALIGIGQVNLNKTTRRREYEVIASGQMHWPRVLYALRCE